MYIIVGVCLDCQVPLQYAPKGRTGGASPKKVDATGERFPRFRGAR
ncbi:hypothetical protein RintRC_0532 [Richelia intracellularis]|nr:hypothetical protein RintRC_0532 [Richelia intracellularis]